jgi:hypothetical protein
MKPLMAVAVILASASTALAGPAFVCSMTNQLKSSDKMEMTFMVTDAATGKGMAIGNAGTTALLITRAEFGLNFFEFTGSGNVMLATVAAPSELPTTGLTTVKYPIVYSRHTVMAVPADGAMSGELVPSQYRGECTLKN